MAGFRVAPPGRAFVQQLRKTLIIRLEDFFKIRMPKSEREAREDLKMGPYGRADQNKKDTDRLAIQSTEVHRFFQETQGDGRIDHVEDDGGGGSKVVHPTYRDQCLGLVREYGRRYGN